MHSSAMPHLLDADATTLPAPACGIQKEKFGIGNEIFGICELFTILADCIENIDGSEWRNRLKNKTFSG